MTHDWTSIQVRRAGLPVMSQKMMTLLYALRDATEQGYPFLCLDGVHGKTLRALQQRDWIVRSIGMDDVRYKITGRGLHALTVYERPSPQRSDGLCPRCGEKPRTTFSTGTPAPYCEDCLKEHGRKQYALKGNQLDPHGLCPKCKKRQRHTYPSGHTIPYCMPCRRKLRKQERRRKHKRLLKRIKAGEFLPCSRCKTQARYHTGKMVCDYCETCYKLLQKQWRKAREGKAQSA